MKRKDTDWKARLRSNLVYGAIVLIPVSILIVVGVELVRFLDRVARVLALNSPLGAGFALLLVLLLLVVACYAIGAIIHTRIGAWSFERLEDKVLRQLPFYKVISRILKGFAAQEENVVPALAQIGPPGTAVMGFIIEENDNGTTTVFVPSIPALTVGSLHVLDNDRVTRLEVSHREFIECLGEWGVGSGKVIGKTKL